MLLKASGSVTSLLLTQPLRPSAGTLVPCPQGSHSVCQCPTAMFLKCLKPTEWSASIKHSLIQRDWAEKAKLLQGTVVETHMVK